MFDLSDRPLVWIPVKWAALKPGTGTKKLATEGEHLIEVEVELLERDDVVKVFNDYMSDELVALAERNSDEAETRGDEIAAKLEGLTGRTLEVNRFLSLVRSWRKVVDQGQAVELNEKNVRKLMQSPGFATAFEAAYLAGIAGKLKTRSGN